MRAPQDAGVVVHYRNSSRALYALEHATALVDRSHWGRLRLSGDDRLAFLHGQTTGDIAALQPGSGCDTVGRSGRCVRGRGKQSPCRQRTSVRRCIACTG